MEKIIENYNFPTEDKFIIEVLNNNNYTFINTTEVFFRNNLFRLCFIFGENSQMLYIDMKTLLSFRYDLYKFIDCIKNKTDIIVSDTRQKNINYYIKMNNLPTYLITLINSLLRKYKNDRI